MPYINTVSVLISWSLNIWCSEEFHLDASLP